MSGKLAEIKNCKKCGSPILTGFDEYCERCKKEMNREQYRDLIDAEHSLKDDAHWLKNYSAWKSIVALPVVILILLILFYVISTITELNK